jgi:hypothetical protein
MASVKNAFKEGFGGTLGSLSAMAIFGLLVVLGLWLVMTSRAKPDVGKERNTSLMILGIVLVVVGSLPFAPLLGIQMLPDLFSSSTNS